MSKAEFLLIKAKIRLKQMIAVCKAISSNQISRYPEFVETFEQRFANYVGKQYGLSFCNGTSAIEAAMFAADIGEGDEVIVPSCTFHASIDPILNLGATPIFADIDIQSLTISPADVEKKITSRTKAVVIVHLFGIPANIGALLEVLKGRGITIIEDASHAHGARWGNYSCGGFGDFGVFSLQGEKAVAAGEGGLTVTDDFSAFIRMSMWGHFTRHSDLFSKIGADEFSYTGIGYKRRMAPLGVLLANADLDHLEHLNKIKRNYSRILDHELDTIDGTEIIRPSAEAVKGGFFKGYPIIINRQDISAAHVAALLNAKGIKAIPYPFVLHHKLPIYIDKEFRQSLIRQKRMEIIPVSNVVLPVTERLEKQLLILSPQYLTTLNKRSLKQIKNSLKSILSGAEKL